MNDPLRIDSHKLHFHPQRVAAWQDADTWEKVKNIYPIYVEVSPVGACNHRCTFCAVDYIGYKSIMLDGAILRNRLREMAQLGVKSVMFAGEGEPLLHKETNANVLGAVGAGIDVAFTTNGVLLHKLKEISACNWVRVSLNAGTAKTYAKVHKTDEKDFETVFRNIEDAVRRKNGCKLGVQMVLLPENVHEIEKLYRRCEKIGVDYVMAKPYSQHKKSITHDYENAQPWDDFLASEQHGHTKFIYRRESAQTKAIPYDKCRATPHFWAYVMASGDVYSCSAYLLDKRFLLGNIARETFRGIWQGDQRRANWNLVSEHLDIHECRVNCRMDKVNRYLDELSYGPEGVNFI